MNSDEISSSTKKNFLRGLKSLGSRKTGILLLATIFLAIAVVVTKAATPTPPPTKSGGLYLSPTTIERDVSPGDNVKLSIKVNNQDDKSQTFFITPANFTADPKEGGSPQFLTTPDSHSLASWIKFPGNSVTLASGERKEIQFNLTVPSGAEAGSHYGAIIISRDDPKLRPTTTSVAATFEVGTLLFVKVSGEVVEQGKVLDFKTSQSAYDMPPVSFEIRFQNTGNVRTKPTGLIEIYNSAGIKEGTVQVNRSFGGVLPETTRKFEDQWNPKPWLNLIPRMGKYTARALITYGLPSKTEQLQPVTFWLIPKMFLAEVGGGLFVIFVLIALFLKIFASIVLKEATSKKK